MIKPVRIRTLLLLGASLPLIVLTVLVVNQAHDRHGVMRSASAMQRDAEGAIALLAADRAVVNELGTADNIAAVNVIGVNPLLAAGSLQIDLFDELSVLADQVDATFADLEQMQQSYEFVENERVTRVLDEWAALIAARPSIHAGTVTPQEVAPLWDGLGQDLRVATQTQLELLTRIDVVGSGEIRTDIQATRVAAQLMHDLQDEIFAMARLVVTELSDGDLGTPRELAVAAALVDDRIENLRSELRPERRPDLDAIKQGDSYTTYVEIRTDVLENGLGRGFAGLDSGVRFIDAGVGLSDELGVLVDEMVSDSRTGAAAIEAEASADLRRSIIAGVVATALTIFVAVMAARTIGRPLGRLEQRARRISDGDLSDQGAVRGLVREVRTAESAMDHMVHNLQILERQADALSTGDLDRASLADETPGRLGRSLRRSVDRLAELTGRLDYQARHDALTGLPNRSAAMTAIEGALGRAQRKLTDVAILFVDLDEFKWVNDANGHAVGDAVLVETARRLRECCRVGDTVGRLGGDEFVVVVEDITELGSAVGTAERILESLAAPYVVDNRVITCAACIGLAWSPHGAGSPSELLHHADLATYRAKEHGGGSLELFDESLRDAVERRRQLEDELSAALADERLELWYQPIMAIADGSVWGFEALVRMRTESGGLLLPNDFIPIAESSDLIVEVDRWVQRTAAGTLARWRDDPSLADLFLAVNVSTRHVQSGRLPDDLLTACRLTGADPSRFHVELTETGLIADLESAAAVLDDLTASQVGLSIDDFGTGHSSVARLRHLPIQRVKIDRSFVRAIDDHADRSVIEAFAALGTALGLEVVAEGVETEDQLVSVRALGCTHVQGFLYGQPVPAEGVSEWLASYSARAITT